MALSTGNSANPTSGDVPRLGFFSSKILWSVSSYESDCCMYGSGGHWLPISFQLAITCLLHEVIMTGVGWEKTDVAFICSSAMILGGRNSSELDRHSVCVLSAVGNLPPL